MKISKINNISFQKKLSARCNVIQNGKPKRVNIYQLEKGVDDDYFIKAGKIANWKQGNYYLREIASDFDKYGSKDWSHFCVMEDDEGNLLGYSEFIKYNVSKNGYLETIETAPSDSIYNKKRRVKYVGETMIAYLVLLCKKENLDFEIMEIAPRKATRDFYYKNCHLEPISKDRAILTKEKFNEFLAQNEAHTGSKIELNFEDEDNRFK